MTINANLILIVLLIPAIGAFVLRRPRRAGPVGSMFWTAHGWPSWFSSGTGGDHVWAAFAQVSTDPPRRPPTVKIRW